MAEETWRILIQDSGVTTGTPQSQPQASSEEKDLPRKQKEFHDQFAQYWKAWRPFIMTGGFLYTMYRGSQIISETTKALFQILGSMVDVFLAPLVPIAVKILEAMASLVPKVAALSTAFFTPIVEWLVPKLESIIDWLNGLNWDAVFATVGKWGEKVRDWVAAIYNWFTQTLWPILTKWFSSLSDIWSDSETGFWEKVFKSFGITWETMSDLVVTAWNSVSKLFNEHVVPVFKEKAEGAWNWVTDKFKTYVINPISTIATALFKDVTANIKYFVQTYLPDLFSWFFFEKLPQVLITLPVELAKYLYRIIDDFIKSGFKTSLTSVSAVPTPTMPGFENLSKAVKGFTDLITSATTKAEKATVHYGDWKYKQLGGFVAESGWYYLHRGEEVKMNANNSQNPVEIHNIFNIELQATGNVDSLVREIEKKVTNSLTSIIRRT